MVGSQTTLPPPPPPPLLVAPPLPPPLAMLLVLLAPPLPLGPVLAAVLSSELQPQPVQAHASAKQQPAVIVVVRRPANPIAPW
jgi:hypothetical protein